MLCCLSVRFSRHCKPLRILARREQSHVPKAACQTRPERSTILHSLDNYKSFLRRQELNPTNYRDHKVAVFRRTQARSESGLKMHKRIDASRRLLQHAEGEHIRRTAHALFTEGTLVERKDPAFQ